MIDRLKQISDNLKNSQIARLSIDEDASEIKIILVINPAEKTKVLSLHEVVFAKFSRLSLDELPYTVLSFHLEEYINSPDLLKNVGFSFLKHNESAHLYHIKIDGDFCFEGICNSYTYE
jgi:hypothetical protein